MRTDTMTTRDEMWAGRVDRAWHQGYVAGVEHWKRIAGVELVLALAALTVRRSAPTPVKLVAFWLTVLLAFVALCILPVALAFLAIRWAIRRHRRPPPSLPPYATVTLSDGSTF
jgi:hypothetical protein